MIESSLQTVLLQNLLDLKADFNSKADTLISILNQSRPHAVLARSSPLSNSNSSSRSHLEHGIRWEADDYLARNDSFLSSAPQLFKLKVSPPESKISSDFLMLNPLHHASSEFLAFRAKKAQDEKRKLLELPAPLETIESCGNSAVGVNVDTTNILEGPLESIESITSTPKRVFKPNNIKSPLGASEAGLEAKESSLAKSMSSSLVSQKSSLLKREGSKKHQNKRAFSMVSGENDLSPFQQSGLMFKETAREKAPPSLKTPQLDANETLHFPVQPKLDHRTIETIQRSNSSQLTASIFYDIFTYTCLIPAFDCKGKRISLDAFDQSDFEGMSFQVNGMHPKSLLITTLDMLMILMNFVCLALVPLLIGFEDLIGFDDVLYFQVTITAVYVLDSLVTMATPQSMLSKTAIYSIREYEVMRPFLNQWIWKWCKTCLIPDILSIVPFNLILPIDSIYARFFWTFRLVRVLRLPYLVHRCAAFTRFRTWLENKWGAGITKVVPIAVAIFIFIHYNACLIYFSGHIHGFSGWDMIWTKRVGATFWEFYIWSFVLGVGNMFPMSFKPQTLVEQFIAIIFIFAGAGLYAVLVGYISSAAMSIDNSGRIYNQKMEELVDYIRWKKLSSETKQKLISYYETKYRGKYFEEEGLLSDMNESLRTEISLQNTRDLITKVPFLRRDASDNRNEIFYSRIAAVLHVRYYIPGDSITKQGELGNDMFFILSGKVDVLVNGTRKVSLYDGAYFGEVALITKALRTATCLAAMPSVVYRLTEQDFHSVISEFPDIKLRISELAYEREKLLLLGEETRLKNERK
ncbi:hypothetical protein BDR26DRAFT_1011274 [Obelidium mucronatum]|nr:hypothetical protein BDR26DRAFT_1011274 [Obelidium mucronatum]